MCGAYVAVYARYSGKTFLRKGSSPNPFPKTFNLNFPQIGRMVIKKPMLLNMGCALSGENLKPKVLGREFEGEPFFKRVSLNDRYVSRTPAR